MAVSSIRLLVVGITLALVASISGCASYPVLDFPHPGPPMEFEPDVQRL